MPTAKPTRAEFSHCGLPMVAVLLNEQSDTEVYAIAPGNLEVFLGYSEGLCEMLSEKADEAIMAAWRLRNVTYQRASLEAATDMADRGLTCTYEGGV